MAKMFIFAQKIILSDETSSVKQSNANDSHSGNQIFLTIYHFLRMNQGFNSFFESQDLYWLLLEEIIYAGSSLVYFGLINTYYYVWILSISFHDSNPFNYLFESFSAIFLFNCPWQLYCRCIIILSLPCILLHDVKIPLQERLIRFRVQITLEP